MTITNCFGKEHLILLVVPEEKNIGLQPYLILFLFYLRASIGGSVVLLVFNTILTLWILIGCFVGFPVDILYKNKEFQLESIEEVK